MMMDSNPPVLKSNTQKNNMLKIRVGLKTLSIVDVVVEVEAVVSTTTTTTLTILETIKDNTKDNTKGNIKDNIKDNTRAKVKVNIKVVKDVAVVVVEEGVVVVADSAIRKVVMKIPIKTLLARTDPEEVDEAVGEIMVPTQIPVIIILIQLLNGLCLILRPILPRLLKVGGIPIIPNLIKLLLLGMR
jgi:hypothetical protein